MAVGSAKKRIPWHGNRLVRFFPDEVAKYNMVLPATVHFARKMGTKSESPFSSYLE
jgi:hypothetical protein